MNREKTVFFTVLGIIAACAALGAAFPVLHTILAWVIYSVIALSGVGVLAHIATQFYDYKNNESHRRKTSHPDSWK